MIRSNPLMLLRIAQADAYAMATEYIKSPRDDAVLTQALKYEAYLRHPSHSLSAGSYTDDTQMSIAVAEVLIEGPPYTKRKFTEAFVRCFKRDYRDGYSRSFQKFLESVKDAADFETRIKPDSTKNGACMRAVPIGVLKTPKEVLDVAALQAATTHDTDEGIFSAQMVALMSHFVLYQNEDLMWLDSFLRKHLNPKGPKTGKDMRDWIPNWSGDDDEGYPTGWSGRVGGPLNVAYATVQAVYWSIVDHKNLKDIMTQIIQWGGDTDSVAAIAWGIASARMGGEELPDFFEWGLEPGRKYGTEFLKSLGKELMEKFK